MSAQHAPTVFVSSTCYDLKQVRRDLYDFIEGYRFSPLLSEYGSFPVSPDATTIDNCRRNVAERADIFVLIVGNRHGSTIADSGRSVTNVEYLQARAKGIPIYTFVMRDTLAILPTWRANPGLTVPGVDNPALFEFIESVRNHEKGWVFPFDTAQDIIEVLKQQWAVLFHEALQLLNRTKTTELARFKDVSGRALQLIIEKPYCWKQHLFSEVLRNEIESASTLKVDNELGLHSGPKEPVTFSEFLEHQNGLTQEMMGIGQSACQLVSDALPKALGDTNDSGDPVQIVYLAKRLGKFYRDALECPLRFLRLAPHEELRSVMKLCASGGVGIAASIEAFSNSIHDQLKQVLVPPADDAPDIALHFLLTLSVPDGYADEIIEEMDRISNLAADGMDLDP